MPLTSTLEFPEYDVVTGENRTVLLKGIGRPEATSYAKEPYSDLSIFEPDSGPAVVRRRTGRSGYVHSVSYVLDKDRSTTFSAFYHTTIADGSLAFNWTDPFTEERKTVRIEPESIRYRTLGPLVLEVSLKLEEV